MEAVARSKHVAVRVNEASLLKNLRHAFSNRYTLVSELMQNARRARATYVAIDYDEGQEILTVRDDGCGIDDFQKLFTFGESGWEQAIVEAETAFGLGFTKSLYSATHCTVVSRGQAISFNTGDALAKRPIEVRTVPTGQETIVSLEGVTLEKLEREIARFSLGFPVKVIYNGVEQHRPYALDLLETVDAPIGRVHLLGMQSGKAVLDSLVFLQGFLIAGDPHYGSSSNIVHLDAAQFHARLPDRDVLIDTDRQIARIDEALRTLWRAHLEKQKAALSGEAFVARWYEAAATWRHLELLDDVPALPGKLFRLITDYPYQEGYGGADYLTTFDRVITQREIASGETQVVALDRLNEDNAAIWMFARAQGFVVFQNPGLSEKHWICSLVTALEDEEWMLQTEEEVASARLEGDFISCKVILCKAYLIRIGDDSVRITDEALYNNDDAVIIIPEEESSGRAVRQATDFIGGDDHFHEDAQADDEQALVDLLWRLRQSDPARVLHSLLTPVDLERYPALHGKSFKVSVDRHGGGYAVDLLS